MPRAERDLHTIFDYIGAATSILASQWFERLLESVEGLSNQPSRHPKTHEDPALRQLLFGERPHIYRVIYQIDPAKQLVNILHIRHHSRRAFLPHTIERP